MDEFGLFQTGKMLYAIASVHPGIDQKPLSLPPPSECLPKEGITEECSSEETVQPPTPPVEKCRWVRCSKRPVFKRRRRIACLILVLLVFSTVGGLLFLKHPRLTDSESLEPVVSSTSRQAPDVVAEDPAKGEAVEERASTGEASSEETVREKEEEGPATPDDPTLYLTVPRLGIYDNTVRNDSSEEALDLGAIKLPHTGFPWQEEEANTYIACHRLGWPGTESYNQCLNLPSMQEGDQIFLKDTNGVVYRYRVVEILIVDPSDTWVTAPVAGKHMISLQTCIEAPDDLYTLGPNWSTRFVVRAERTEEGQAGGFKRLVEDSMIAHAGLVHKSLSHYGRVMKDAKKALVVLGKMGPVLPRTEVPKLFKGIL
jgi:sortase A